MIIENSTYPVSSSIVKNIYQQVDIAENYPGTGICNLILELREILEKVDVDIVLAGSVSAVLGANGKISKDIHEIDIIVPNAKIKAIGNILVNSDFTFWNEDLIHRTVRNLTGGFGRHHNYGFSSRRYLKEDGTPIWGGIFTYEENIEGISFYEYFSVSERKVKLMIRNIINKYNNKIPLISWSVGSKQLLTSMLRRDIYPDSLHNLVIIMQENGLDFWTETDEPVVNNIDLFNTEIYRLIKNITSGNHPLKRIIKAEEHFFEFYLKITYPISAKDYLFTNNILLDGEKVYIIPLEMNYLRLSKFFPHYLGPRKKYLVLASKINRTGYLDLRKYYFYNAVYSKQRREKKLVDDYLFKISDDHILNKEILNSIWANSKEPLQKGMPNYLSLLGLKG